MHRHVERLNGTQRLFMKRLNRLTYCFSKKLRNLEAAFGDVRGLLQFLLADPDAGNQREEAADSRHDGRNWPGTFGASTSCSRRSWADQLDNHPLPSPGMTARLDNRPPTGLAPKSPLQVI